MYVHVRTCICNKSCFVSRYSKYTTCIVDDWQWHLNNYINITHHLLNAVCNEGPSEVCLVIDTGSAMGFHFRPGLVIEFTKSLVDSLSVSPNDTRIAAVWYTYDAVSISPGKGASILQTFKELLPGRLLCGLIYISLWKGQVIWPILTNHSII